VRGAISDNVSAAEKAKPFSSRIGTGMGVAPVNLCAGLAEHQDRHEHGDLSARDDDDLVGRDGYTRALFDVSGHRLAQRQDAGCRRVAMVTVAQGLHGRLDDVGGRREIRLADAQIDDVPTLVREIGGTGEHGEGVLLADAREGRNKVRHNGCFRDVGGFLRIKPKARAAKVGTGIRWRPG
jgi:hypothetical protein